MGSFAPGRNILHGLIAFMIVSLGLAVVSCGSNKGTRLDNLPPHVRLTGGPIEGDSASYSSEFLWTGWDDDGVIDHYQYAVDIPDNFSLEDINNPEDVGIAWTDTTAFRARFLFTTPTQDTVTRSDGSQILPNRFRGSHTIYVRAVDNEGGVSTASYLSFTARTVTPQTTITVPNIASGTGAVGYITVGTQFRAVWTGVDPDNPDPKRRPAYYEWKLVPVRSVLGVTDPSYVLNVEPGGNIPWVRTGVDSPEARVSLNPPQAYVFGVRAVDEAGGKESKFFFGQNAVLMSSSRGPFVGRPVLTTKERTLGNNIFPLDGEKVQYELPQGKCLRFTFSADAQSYGGEIQAYNWGVDVSDDDAEGPNSGWRGWSKINYTYEPICFPEPGTHIVYIKVRDTGGAVTIGKIELTVISFPLDREVLYVDDYYKSVDTGSSLLTDRYVDDKFKNALRASGIETVYEINPWGIDDSDGAVNQPRLSQLASYKLLVWNVLGVGGGSQNGVTALLQGAACPTNRIVQAYVSAGGSIMISGEVVFGTLKDRNGGVGQCLATTSYSPEVGLNFADRDFVCDYLHICGGDIRDAKTATTSNGLIRAIPTATALASKLPLVEVDSMLYATSLGGLPFVDAQFQPLFNLVGGLDTLYTADTARRASGFYGKPIAWRYHDLDPVPSQGPVALFAFPLHRMKEGTVWAGPAPEDAPGTHFRGLVSAMVYWFQQHQSRAQQFLRPE